MFVCNSCADTTKLTLACCPSEILFYFSDFRHACAFRHGYSLSLSLSKSRFKHRSEIGLMHVIRIAPLLCPLVESLSPENWKKSVGAGVNSFFLCTEARPHERQCRYYTVQFAVYLSTNPLAIRKQCNVFYKCYTVQCIDSLLPSAKSSAKEENSKSCSSGY